MVCGWTSRQAGKATSFGLSEPPSSSLPKAESRPACGRWTLTLTTVCFSKRSIPESRSLVAGLRGSSEVAQPVEKPPGEGTGPAMYGDFRGNLVGRVPSRGERDVFELAGS